MSGYASCCASAPVKGLNNISLSHSTWACAVMQFSCDDRKISCDDKLDEASKCITGGFRALGRSSVLWDAIFRRPSRLQANTSLLLDLAAHLVLNEFQLILLHQTCACAISFPSNFLRSPYQLSK